MKNKGKHQQYSFDYHDGHNPDFDLDEYIREKSQETGELSSSNSPETKHKDSYRFKNAMLVLMVCALAFLWYHDWNPAQAWGSIFGNNEATMGEVIGSAPSFTIPDVPAPPAPPVPGINTEEGFVNYLAELQEAGLSDVYSNSGWQALYQTGVPIEYLTQLFEEGYLDSFSYSAIAGLYSGGVNIDYLNSLRDAGYLDSFSYSAIIGLYNGGVEIAYLEELSANNLLDEFSYSAIIALYNSGVTIDYLNRLRDNNLLEGMSYTDIIVAYNTDN